MGLILLENLHMSLDLAGDLKKNHQCCSTSLQFSPGVDILAYVVSTSLWAGFKRALKRKFMSLAAHGPSFLRWATCEQRLLFCCRYGAQHWIPTLRAGSLSQLTWIEEMVPRLVCIGTDT